MALFHISGYSDIFVTLIYVIRIIGNYINLNRKRILIVELLIRILQSILRDKTTKFKFIINKFELNLNNKPKTV